MTNSIEAARNRLMAGRTLAAKPQAWTVGMPSRGHGDIVAKITHATDIPQVAPTTSNPCGGCAQRKLPTPSVTRRAMNLAKALAWFTLDRFRTVDQAEYERRLAVCAECEWQDGNWCRNCGCYLPAKAGGRVWMCPLGKWN
jgi:hypothetical protein